MEYRRKEIGAGLVVIVSLGLLLGMLALSSNVQDLLRKKKNVRVLFEQVEGVERNSPVKQAGRLVGKVAKIDVSPSKGNKVELSLQVLSDTIVKLDSEASIKSPLVGEKYIDLGLGTPQSPALLEEQILTGKESLRLDQLTDTIIKVVEDINVITTDIKTITGDSRFKDNILSGAANLQEASDRINSLVKNNSGDIDSIIRDLKRVSNQLNATARQLNALTLNMNKLVEDNGPNISSTIANLRDTPGQIVEQLELVQESVSAPFDDNRDNVQRIIANLEITSRNLTELSNELKKRPYLLLRKSDVIIKEREKIPAPAPVPNPGDTVSPREK